MEISDEEPDEEEGFGDEGDVHMAVFGVGMQGMGQRG